MARKIRYIVGIDEAGRGPIAGPVAVGLVKLNPKFNLRLIANVKDSKKLSAKQREQWFIKIVDWQDGGVLEYSVTLVGNKIIERVGITRAIKIGINRLLHDCVSENCEILLDGLLKAPKKFKNQKTIIKGDEKIPVIALASIVAKVRRDRAMEGHGLTYPQYGFERHKGYGTKAHYTALKSHGLCPCHRKNFLGKLLNPVRQRPACPVRNIVSNGAKGKASAASGRLLSNGG